jgi:hypothetical protein
MSHYTVNASIESMDDLRAMFPTGEADELNWCFLSTSGVHGSYATLDDVERTGAMEITVLVCAPRMVRMNYGNVMVTPDDVPWLRNLARSTVEAVARSQGGNL